jgi:hypothetical protein
LRTESRRNNGRNLKDLGVVTDRDRDPSSTPDPLCELVRLVDRQRVRAHRIARAQYLAAMHDRSMHHRLGIPAVTLSAVAGATIFASVGSDLNLFAVIGVGLISLLAAVLAALQTFLGYSERAEKHRVAATRYNDLKRRLDLLLARLYVAAPPLNDVLLLLQSEVDRFAEIEKESLDVPDRYYDQARREQDRDNEGI